VERAQVPEDVLAKEQEIYRQKAVNDGRPPQAIDKIVAGQVEKFYETVCLLDQPYIREPKKKVQEILNEATAKLGERIVARRFVRYRVGAEE
jgi:elongation factor Ts